MTTPQKQKNMITSCKKITINQGLVNTRQLYFSVTIGNTVCYQLFFVEAIAVESERLRLWGVGNFLVGFL